MDSPVSRKAIVLGSGFGLGFYIPAVLIRDRLRQLGLSAEVEIFENLLTDAKIQMVERNRRAYHQSFRVALASQKVPTDSNRALDPNRVEALLTRWALDSCHDFICISGHWVPILDSYRESKADSAIRADLLYLDVELSPSWKWLRNANPRYAAPYHEFHLYDAASLDMRYFVDVDGDAPVPYVRRERRVVTHGGGWGIGTYQQRITEIEAAGYAVDVVCYSSEEAVPASVVRRYFMDDPAWRTWQRGETGQHTFPPFGEIVSRKATVFESQVRCHGLYRVIRHALAVVSKAGAGTLIDSFSSATPLIVLDPFGPHEERNGRVWLNSGFGVPYRVWADAGYPISMLEELHSNLLVRRAEMREYVSEYAQRVFQAAGG
jgi:hypothetical protein